MGLCGSFDVIYSSHAFCNKYNYCTTFPYPAGSPVCSPSNSFSPFCFVSMETNVPSLFASVLWVLSDFWNFNNGACIHTVFMFVVRLHLIMQSAGPLHFLFPCGYSV